MAMKITVKIIVEDAYADQEEMEVDGECGEETWEADIYQLCCAAARKAAIEALKAIDKRILHERPKSLKVHDSASRTRVTRFGMISVCRRLYQDKDGSYHYLLDEHLNWQPYKWATPSMRESLVDMSTQTSFGKVSKTMERFTAGVLSRSTIHRMLQEVSETAVDVEKQEWEYCFNEGKLPKPGVEKVSLLYTEADGVNVHLQREGEQKRYELKGAIAYDGWELVSDERYALVNKRVYSHSNPEIPFWDGASLQWNRYWDMSCVEQIVLGGDDAIGGDDANWINTGAMELPYCIRQLDGFHLARSCRRGWKKGDDMYAAMRSGRARFTLGQLEEREGKTAQKERNHVLKCLDRGVDWRKQVEGTPSSFLVSEQARGLGTMESNEDKLFADRMKKRGISWTIKGAQHMGKAIQLVVNGDLKDYCGRKPPDVREHETVLSFDVFDYADGNRASVPALYGPHAARPWVKVIPSLTEN